MKNKSKVLLIWVISSTLFLTGCWDHKETGEVALVMGMGIDKGEDGLYVVSFQIVNPAQLSGGKEQGQGGGTPVSTYTATGETILEAVRIVSQEVPRMLSFSHAVVLIIGEELAADEGLYKVLDFIERYHDFRSTAQVLIARDGTALSVLSILSQIETIPAMKIEGTVKKTGEVWGETTQRNVNDVVKALSNGGKGLSLGGVMLVGEVQKGNSLESNQQTIAPAITKISGLSIFKNGKLEDWLDGEDARGVAWIQNKIDRTILTAACGEDEGRAGAEILRTNTKWESKINQGEPQMILHIRAEGELSELSCPLDLTDPKQIFKLNDKFEAEIEEDVTKALETVQEQKNDIFGFGEAFNRSHPKNWKEMKGQWEETFATMEVQVKAKVFIRSPGLRQKPLMWQKEQKEG